MTPARDQPQPSDAARTRFDAPATRLHLLADLSRMVWLHFACAPDALKPRVPFELDTRDGSAFVSVIVGTMRRLRPQLDIDNAQVAPGLERDQPFVAVRTPVWFENQPARFNLAWWAGTSQSPLLASGSYGLSALPGAIELHHQHEQGALSGSLAQGDARFAYEASIDPSSSFEPAAADSLDAFLLERYAILTAADRVRRAHWLWHRPWAQTPVAATVTDGTLLRPWLGADAKLVAAHYAPGACDVWVSRPLCVEGAACARVWGDLPSDAAKPQAQPATSSAS